MSIINPYKNIKMRRRDIFDLEQCQELSTRNQTLISQGEKNSKIERATEILIMNNKIQNEKINNLTKGCNKLYQNQIKHGRLLNAIGELFSDYKNDEIFLPKEINIINNDRSYWEGRKINSSI